MNARIDEMIDYYQLQVLNLLLSLPVERFMKFVSILQIHRQSYCRLDVLTLFFDL